MRKNPAATFKKKFGKHQKRNISKTDLAVFLKGLNFESNKIEEHNLNIFAFGKYQQKEAIFKLSSTKENSSRVENEYNWNDAVHRISDKKHPNFTVPKNLDCGNYHGLFYLIAERFSGVPLSLSTLIDKIHQLAKVSFEIRNLPITKNNKKTKPIGHSLFEVATEWVGQIPLDLDEFLKILESSKESLRTSPGHGGFELRHLFEVEGRIGLIDGELAGVRGAMYYDAAFFYIRLRNDFDNSLLALQYLTYFYNLLTASEQKTFWEEIKPPLIVRYLGDLWGAKKNKKKLADLETLGRDILKDKILEGNF